MLHVPIDKIVPLTTARDTLSKIIADVESGTPLYLLTKNGKPAVAVMSIAELQKQVGPVDMSTPTPTPAPSSTFSPAEPQPASTPTQTPPPPTPSTPKPTTPSTSPSQPVDAIKYYDPSFSPNPAQYTGSSQDGAQTPGIAPNEPDDIMID